jgi:hypothetical protein
MPTEFLRYCCLVFSAAWGHSRSWTQGIIFFILVIIGWAALLAPKFGMTIEMGDLMDLLKNPTFYAILFGSVVLLRLACAPYWVWSEELAARKRAESQITELTARYAQLFVSDPYSIPNSSSGAISWVIKIHNAGASAGNVHMSLCDIFPRPKSQFWDAAYPYPVVQKGRTLNSNECHIHQGGEAIFELTKIELAAHNSGFLTTLDTRITGSNRVKIEPNERWEKMDYAVAAENAVMQTFILRMNANSQGVAFEKVA